MSIYVEIHFMSTHDKAISIMLKFSDYHFSIGPPRVGQTVEL